MIGYYNYTVILTYIGTFYGFLGITFAWNGDTKTALMFLLIAGFCDMFDGKIASTRVRTPQEKRFGIQIDSLSDVICFGVLPASIVFGCSGGNLLYTSICAVYMLCALIRLAWFNVDEEDRQTKEDGVREGYLGLPVTTSALLVPFFMGLGNILKLPMAKVSPWALLVVGALFLTPFRLRKPKLVGKIIMMIIGAGCLVVVMIGVR